MSSSSAASTAASGPILMNGNTASAVVRSQVAADVATIVATGSPAPCLAVVLVGSRKDSQTYVNMKTKACKEAHITAQQFDLPDSTTTAELLTLIAKLNADPLVNGILVQLPLPAAIDSDLVISRITPFKDVDGLTATNAGELLRCGSQAALIPCTPLGCMELLSQHKINLNGKHCVVLGRSNLVGKPIAQLLLSQNATVTMCHSRTIDLPAHVARADVVVAAIGKAHFVKAEWLKPQAVVIDVGINAVDDASKKNGYRLVGDCATEECNAKASYITPVPGGVGPMTVAMLLRNTVTAYHMQHQQQPTQINGH